MTETNQTASGTNQITAPEPRRGVRLAGLLGILLLCFGAFLGMEVGSLQHVVRLERTLADARPTSFLVGMRLRQGLEQLTASLLRFELSGDDAERSRFQATARDLSERLAQARHTLLTPREREEAQAAGEALNALLDKAGPMLMAGRRGIRRDTAAELHQEIQRLAAPLSQLSDRLAAVQEEAAADFFAGAQQSLRSLRHWLIGSWMLFVVLLGLVAFLGHRVLVAPLRMQLTESHALMERQERLASLGVLTAGVAHEIRNPLAAIKFRIYSVRKSLPPADPANEDLAIMDGEIQRLDRILKDFLQFARPSEPDRQPVVLSVLLQEVRNLLQDELQRRGLRLEVLPGDSLTLQADRQQLQQVLINLIQNAAEASESGGVVTLSARAGGARRTRNAEPVILVEVADSGRGLDPEVGRRIFDPFFSTKEGGTGLGLPMAARIVEMHGGLLQYASQVGRGSTFTLVLPQNHHHETGQTAVD